MSYGLLTGGAFEWTTISRPLQVRRHTVPFFRILPGTLSGCGPIGAQSWPRGFVVQVVLATCLKTRLLVATRFDRTLPVFGLPAVVVATSVADPVLGLSCCHGRDATAKLHLVVSSHGSVTINSLFLGHEPFSTSCSTREILEMKVFCSADAVEENVCTFIEPRTSQHAYVMLSKSLSSSQLVPNLTSCRAW